MELNKQDILNLLNKYNLNSEDYTILSGASLVLQDVKPTTTDIDIAVSDNLYKKLLKEYDCNFERSIGKHNIYFIDNIINFSTNYYDTTNHKNHLGYKVQTLESILELKKNLNRPKDQKDIEKIINFTKKAVLQK